MGPLRPPLDRFATRARARLAGLVPIVLAPRSYVACAAIGLACAIAATLARGVLVAELGSNLRWPTYFLSVLIAAVLGGPTGTVAAILASVVLGSTVFVPQPFAYPARLAFDAVSVGLFAAIASCIATVAILLRHALLRVHERTRALEREIARRKAAEDLAGARSAELESVLTALPVAVWFGRDATCDVVVGNPAAYAIFGATSGNLSPSAPPAERSDLLRVRGDGGVIATADLPMQRAGRTGRPVLGETIELEFRDGRRTQVLMSAVPLHEPDGSVRGVVGAGLDVTAEAEARMELAFDNEALSRLVAVGGRCASSGASLQECLDEILAAALVLTGATRGTLQLFEPASRTLRLAAHHGFAAHFTDFFAIVGPDGAAACSAALDASQRVVVEDVEASALFDRATRGVLRDAGVRAVQSTPLRSVNGNVLGVVSTHFAEPHTPRPHECRLLDLLARQAADFLERRASHEVLRESERRFRTLADGVPAHVWVSDTNGDAAFVNARFREYTGTTEEQPSGPAWRSAVHPDDAAVWFPQVEATRASLSPFRGEVRLRGHDGAYRWFEVGGSPRFEGDRFAGYAGISIDVTERKRIEAALEESSRRKDEFLAMLGHELRNPLAAIRNSVVAATSLDEQHRATALTIARRQTDQLGRLVDDLLDVARITQGQINLQRERVSLQEVIARAREAVEPLRAELRHALAVDVPAQAMLVDGDAARLEQVLVNLLGNACKYTPPGGRIQLTLTRADNDAVLRVRDSGIGIAPELRPHVFELFTQAERSLDRRQGGLGVGLTVADRLVRLHGGRIDAFSDGPGKGSEFVVHLPLLAAASEEHRPPAASDPMAAGASRLLLVEDNADIAESMRLLLELLGHQVRVAHDGLAALDAARLERPDVMLVDIGLPGIDGYEVARRVRRDAALRDVTLVALTGYGRDEDRSTAIDAGFDHHLVKPIDPDTLESLIANLSRRTHEVRPTLQ